MTTDKIAEVWPTAKEIGMTDERAAFGLQFGHGLGVGLYESPMISRLHSFDAPVELEVGMVFALETYCPATRRPLGRADRGGGRRHARPGPQVLTRFPADELLVTGKTYVRGRRPRSTARVVVDRGRRRRRRGQPDSTRALRGPSTE